MSGHASVINLSVGGANPCHAKVSNGKHGAANADGNNKSDAGGHVNGKAADVRRAAVVVVMKADIKGAAETKSAADGKPSNGKTGGDGPRWSDGGRRKSTSSAEDGEHDTADSPAGDMEEASSPASKSSPASPAAAPSGTSSLLTPGSLTPGSAFLDPSFYKGKKSQEQLNALKDSFLRGQFPDQEEVDRLIALTGLTVREVRKWFSDRRYHFRNLKGVRSGGHGKSGAGTGSGGVEPSDSGGNPEARTPQHGSAPLSPTPSQTPASPTTPSRRLPRPPSPDFTAIRYKEREPHQVKALEASFVQDPDPAGEEVDRLRSETKMTRREIHGWFADRRKRVAAERKKEEAQRATRVEEAEGEEPQREDGSGELKVNPIKINLKMLKVTEANGKAEADASDSPLPPASSPGAASSSAPKPSHASTPAPRPAHSPKPAAVRGKKTAEQLQTLKQVYARTQWPSAAQYDDMLSNTGLARPEVVRWFGDCRYVQKNGQLKWLEAYQTAALEEELRKGGAGAVLQAHYDAHGSPEESQLQDLAQSSGLTADLVRHWFSTKASPPRPEPTTTAAAHEEEPRTIARSAGGGAEEEEEEEEKKKKEKEKEEKAGEKKEELKKEETKKEELKKEETKKEELKKEETKKAETKKEELKKAAEVIADKTVNLTEGTA